MPTQIGSCVDTTIAFVGGRLDGDSTFQSGVFVGFTNGGTQITFGQDAGMMHSQRGDEVHTCLVQLPTNCPPGDNRGKIYTTTNTRTGESWTQGDAEHGCGGA
jgi:hypothetical protein